MKTEKLRAKRQAEETRQEEARLRKEQRRKVKEEKLAKLNAGKEAKLKEQAQARQRKGTLRMHLAQGKIYYYRQDYEQAMEEFNQS